MQPLRAISGIFLFLGASIALLAQTWNPATSVPPKERHSRAELKVSRGEGSSWDGCPLGRGARLPRGLLA